MFCPLPQPNTPLSFIYKKNTPLSIPDTKQPIVKSGKAGHPEANCKSNDSAISIVGIGGVGMTNLAQYIYNDPMVKNHFGTMI
jgi:hypothetical protein